MLRRWHVVLLILVTLAAFCGLAATKLRATPKYDRVQVGMSEEDIRNVLGYGMFLKGDTFWPCFEGDIFLRFEAIQNEPTVAAPSEPVQHPSVTYVVVEKRIQPRSPLERLAWLAGWH